MIRGSLFSILLLTTSIGAATPRPLPEHPGNIFLEGESVLVTRAPFQVSGWTLLDYDGKTISQSNYGAEAIDFGKLPVGYYELRSGTSRTTFGVIAPLTQPEPRTTT